MIEEREVALELLGEKLFMAVANGTLEEEIFELVTLLELVVERIASEVFKFELVEKSIKFEVERFSLDENELELVTE